jgi:dTDP-4-dehydrorhamnose 3,5-epimerase
MPEPGVRERLVQDNQSFSTLNVLRGLHYQLCHPQGKFVRVVTGRDLRRSGGLTTQFADLWPVARSHVIWREQADVVDSTRTAHGFGSSRKVLTFSISQRIFIIRSVSVR